ncbi:MAG: YcaO-like family protein [Thermodesulfobacteriota bacterium]|nr:YcaO-like family protein [Thermodesulfobacteriota bacterium]
MPLLTPMRYELRLVNTESGTGVCACLPPEGFGLSEAVLYLKDHPLDDFMHKYALDEVGKLELPQAKELLAKAEQDGNAAFLSVFFEASLVHEKFAAFRNFFESNAAQSLRSQTPLVSIISSALSDQELHRQWTELFRTNIQEHKPLPGPKATGLDIPFKEEDLERVRDSWVSLFDARAGQGKGSGGGKEKPVPLEQTVRRAERALEAAGVVLGPQVRHQACLSPVGLLRPWRVSVSVKNRRLDYTLSGDQTSYGRGLEFDQAWAALLMEIVERWSSWASFDGLDVPGYAAGHCLVRAGYSELHKKGVAALDPNEMRLEVPYQGDSLYWIEAQTPGDGAMRSVLVPAQCVFSFCNLDERDLFSGVGSTGLAAGNTVEQARASGLLEVLERDAVAVSPYSPDKCFRIQARDKTLSALLEKYGQKGVDVFFQDVTTEFGIPCYKAFVIGPEGQIIMGAAARLNGRKALVSALTETPYPYPFGPKSRFGPQGLPVRIFEDLPDYSTGSHPGDLKLIERTLLLNDLRPLYVDLTRSDLKIPVVRAMIPGLELMADFDCFSRVSRRLFANYVKIFSGNKNP